MGTPTKLGLIALGSCVIVATIAFFSVSPWKQGRLLGFLTAERFPLSTAIKRHFSAHSSAFLSIANEFDADPAIVKIKPTPEPGTTLCVNRADGYDCAEKEDEELSLHADTAGFIAAERRDEIILFVGGSECFDDRLYSISIIREGGESLDFNDCESTNPDTDRGACYFRLRDDWVLTYSWGTFPDVCRASL